MQSLADSNLWLALTLSKHVFHEASRRWVETLEADDRLLFCQSTQQTFLRLLTTEQVLAPYGNKPLSNADAWAKYEEWLAIGWVSYAEEPQGIETHWRRLAKTRSSSPKLWMDAYLAAFAIAGGFQIVTTDKAFKQFRGLDCVVLGDSEGLG